MEWWKKPIEGLIDSNGFECACGRVHKSELKHLEIGPGVIRKLPEMLKRLGIQHPFLVCDGNTWNAAGERVQAVLGGAGIGYTRFAFVQNQIEAEEKTLGRLAVAFDPACDGIVALGSGTINDLCKMLSSVSGRPMVFVATAPSMDGFASSTSSMIVDGVKQSVNSRCPDGVLADIDVLSAAPIRLLQAGFGDMLAKYVSLCEWELSHIITGEYCCPSIVKLVQTSLEQCVAAAPGLLNRDEKAVGQLTEGLILSGMAMAFAGLSRPASGLEHYISHVWDMQAVERGLQPELHGIQVGLGTLLTVQMYNRMPCTLPDKQLALQRVAEFDGQEWKRQMKAVFGAAAGQIIHIERQSGKNDAQKHAPRLDIILANWEQIVATIDRWIPPYARLYGLLKELGAPVNPVEIGIGKDQVRQALYAAKEIRDKYVGTRLFWDLGILEEMIDQTIG